MAKRRGAPRITKYRRRIKKLEQRNAELENASSAALAVPVAPAVPATPAVPAGDPALLRKAERLSAELAEAKEQIGGLKSELERYQSMKMRDFLKSYHRYISSLCYKIEVADDVESIRKTSDSQMDRLCEDAETFGAQLSLQKPGDELGDAYVERKDEIPTNRKELDGRVKRCVLMGCKVDAIPSYSFGEQVQVWKYDPSYEGDGKE